MCGIAGIIAPRLSPSEIQQAAERMSAAIIHRGPDEEGLALHSEIHTALASRRLSIVGLADGRQPISNEDGSIQVVFNGEIYNHKELRARLERQGHHLKTSTDTEVISHLYEEHGEDFLNELNGMFAIALLDLRRRKLLLARDGAGIKPLYYADTGDKFLFASEIKALLAAGLIEAAPDWQGLDAFLTARFIPAPLTAFAGVKKLLAGERVVLENIGGAESRLPYDKIRHEQFWKLIFSPPNRSASDADLLAELEHIFVEAVKSQLAADVPVGAFLSGGWDSSLVCRIAAEHVTGRLKTFSIVFPEHPKTDESQYSRLMAKTIGSDHEEVEFRDSTAHETLERAMWHLEEPITGPAQVEFQVAELASRRVKAVVTGQGSDELFGGYMWLRIDGFYKLQTLVPRFFARLAEPLLRSQNHRYSVKLLTAPNEIDADIDSYRDHYPRDRDRFINTQLDPARDDCSPFRVDSDTLDSCADRLQRRISLDFSKRLADSILLHGDKMTMAHSLEARVPFLDRSMVEFAARLPSNQKIRDGQEKFILKGLADKLLPPDIAGRKKQGLTVPERQMMKGPFLNHVCEYLLDSCRPTGPYRRDAVERMTKAWRNGDLNRSGRPWSLYVLQVWWNRFMPS